MRVISCCYNWNTIRSVYLYVYIYFQGKITRHTLVLIRLITCVFFKKIINELWWISCWPRPTCTRWPRWTENLTSKFHYIVKFTIKFSQKCDQRVHVGKDRYLKISLYVKFTKYDQRVHVGKDEYFKISLYSTIYNSVKNAFLFRKWV